MAAWQEKHCGFCRCATSRSRTVVAFTPTWFSVSAGTTGGGGRRRRAHDALQHIGAAHHGRSAVRIGAGHQHATLAQQAPAGGVLELDLAELVAAHAVDVVLQGQSLVEEGVVRAQQLQHALVIAEDVVDEQGDLLLEVIAQVGRAAGVGKDRRIRVDLGQLGQVQPLRAEVGGQRERARIGQHALDLRARSSSGSCSLPLPATSQQLVVRQAAPQEERQARGQA